MLSRPWYLMAAPRLCSSSSRCRLISPPAYTGVQEAGEEGAGGSRGQGGRGGGAGTRVRLWNRRCVYVVVTKQRAEQGQC
jgi:hypothetical protein